MSICSAVYILYMFFISLGGLYSQLKYDWKQNKNKNNKKDIQIRAATTTKAFKHSRQTKKKFYSYHKVAKVAKYLNLNQKTFTIGWTNERIEVYKLEKDYNGVKSMWHWPKVERREREEKIEWKIEQKISCNLNFVCDFVFVVFINIIYKFSSHAKLKHKILIGSIAGDNNNLVLLYAINTSIYSLLPTLVHDPWIDEAH